MCFPRGKDGLHQVRNATESPIRVLMLSTLLAPDIVEYPDSGKVGAVGRSRGEAQLLRDRSAAPTREYWDGASSLLAERVLAGERLADDERVHLVRALVREHRLEVVHVADHRVLERDAVRRRGSCARSGATSSAPRTLPILPRLTCSGRSVPASFIRPRWSATSERAVELERHLGELLLRELVAGDRLAEDDPLLRVLERRLEARARGADGAEDDPEARLVEARERAAQRRRPREARFSSGTRTSWSTSSDVTDARSESFLWISGAEKPGMPCSTMKPRIAPSSVRAQTTAMSAIVPFVIHIFAPFRIQSEPSRRACVRIEPGSEPASGSVRPKQPIDLARVHRRQPALLLLLRAQRPDREHRERALHGDGAADARVARLELQARQAVGDGARAGEAVAVEVHPEADRASRAPGRSRAGRCPARTSRRPRRGRSRARTAAPCRGSRAPRRRAVRRSRGSRAGRERDARWSSPCAGHPTEERLCA